MTSSTTQIQSQSTPCSGTSRDFYVEWQGRLYGPYQSETDAFLKDKFRFDGGHSLNNPLESK
jgi:hypothetical protein